MVSAYSNLTDTTQLSTTLNIVFYALGGAHILFSVLMTTSYWWKWTPVILFQRNKEREDKELKEKVQNESGNFESTEKKEEAILEVEEEEEKENAFIRGGRNLYYLLTDPWWIYHLIYLVLSCVGTIYFPVFAFHMLDIPFRNPQVQSVVQAVTTNGVSLLLTAGLGLTVIYLYSVVGFFTLRELYSIPNGMYCDTLWDCFITNYLWG